MIETIKTVLGIIISLSTVLGIFTGIVNKLFTKKLKPLEDKIEENRLLNLKQSMEEWRFQVVSFSSELRNGVPKSRFEFETIFIFINEYEEAVEELGITNNFFSEEVVYIKNCYRDLMNKK